MQSVRVIIAAAMVAFVNPLVAQAVTVDVGARTGSFDYRGAAPISPTSVIQLYFAKADSGARLGYAVVIRGPRWWYNAKTSMSALPAERIPAGGIAEQWQVGERRYEVVFDPQRSTLALFDTVVDLRESPVVLVTLSDTVGGKATVQRGAPSRMLLTREMENPVLQFVRSAPDVQAFATPPSLPALRGVDGTRLRAGMDTLHVWRMQGTDSTRTGTIIDELRVSDEGGQRVLRRSYRTIDDARGTSVDSMVDRLPSLAPLEHRSYGSNETTSIRFADGRVKGTIRPTTGDSVVLDSPVPEGIINFASFDLAVRAAPLAVGLQAEVPALLASQRAIAPLRIHVTRLEQIGGMRCWRVEAEFTGMPVIFWVSEETRTLCRQEMRPGPGVVLVFARPAGR
jgi:hypothetical protein